MTKLIALGTGLASAISIPGGYGGDQNEFDESHHLYLGQEAFESIDGQGRLQDCMAAHISIFDAATMTDYASYRVGTNGLPYTGIPCLTVNDTVDGSTALLGLLTQIASINASLIIATPLILIRARL